MQTIQVHYRSSSRTARAFCAGGSLSLPVNDIRNEAILVAKALMKKLDWTGDLVDQIFRNETQAILRSI